MLEHRVGIVRGRELRDRLALGVVAATGEFADDPGVALERHTPRIRDGDKKGSGTPRGGRVTHSHGLWRPIRRDREP
ncbi:hypothetical protein GCM10028856_39020 [Halopiger thermotolerans]